MTIDRSEPSTEDEHVAQLLAAELAALTRVLFGVTADEAVAEPSHQPAEHAPTQLTSRTGPPQAIQLPAVIELPVATEPDEAMTAGPAPSDAATAIPLPATPLPATPLPATPTAIPLPAIPLSAIALAAEPLPDEIHTASGQPGGQRADTESLDLLAEIAFLDE